MKSKITREKEGSIKALFIKSFKLAKSNPNKAGLMILFDLMFLASTFALLRLNNFFAQSIIMPKTVTVTFVLLITFSLIYYLLVLFVYSFFKYSILDFIKSLFDETEFSFKRLGQFYSLNIITAGIFFAVMLLFSFLLMGVKELYRPFVFVVLATPYLLFLYVIINISHSLFYQGNSVKETIKKSFNIAFTKIRIYRETILAMILFALLLWILFSGSKYLLQNYAYQFSLANSRYINQIYIIIFDLAFYFVVLINRISFYAIIRENK